MNFNDVNMIGLVRDYPKFKYSTTELIDILGNKLSEKVKENITQLGVEHRFFIKPIEHYLLNSEGTRPTSEDHEEPISDMSAQIAKKCLENLDLKPDNVTSMIAASENNDYLSPGLASILVRKIGLSNFLPHYNIQGMACSTLHKVLELGRNLVHDENDKVLIVISGCNSGWYLPHLKNNMAVKNPKEVVKKQYDRDEQIKKWVSTMFSFLFGDGVVAFVLSKTKDVKNTLKIGKITHAVNFENDDYQKACVQLTNQYSNHLYEYDLTAGSNILELSLDYSKKVLMKFLGKDPNFYDQNTASSFMSKMEKVMIHTGSLKILDGFKNCYDLRNEQIQESYETLRGYGNLTGCSIPTVIGKTFEKNNFKNGKALLIGITMGFGLDMVEVEKIN